MRITSLALIFCGWGLSTALLHGQETPQDKKDPTSFPLVVRSTTLTKPRIMSLVVDVKGEGNRFFSDEESFTLVPGRLIPSKGLLIVPSQSQVIFRPMPGITTLVDEDSKLQMKGLSVVKSGDKIAKRKAFLYLNEGSVFTSIQKLNNKTTTYEIQTPQAVAGAKGTKFWVRYKGGQGKVVVINGVVEVKLTNGAKVSLKQDQVLEMKGIGPELKASDVRFSNAEEKQENEQAAQESAKVEGAIASATNPFLTTSEAVSKDANYTELLVPDVPSTTTTTTTTTTANPSNTSGSTTTVSPTGP